MTNFLEADKYLFTSESVTEGHPDKLCDATSDAVLDAILAGDPTARVACECAATTGLMLVTGEITTSTYVDIPSVVRRAICEIGYTDPAYGFDADSCGIITSVKEQSPDIAQGVNRALELREGEAAGEAVDGIGAGDQGMMFGFACRETPELMPLPIMLAHQLAKQLAAVRKNGELGYLRPDGKTQMTVEYSHGVPVRVDTVVVAAQHNPDVVDSRLREDITERVIRAIIPAELMDGNTRVIINGTGRFVLGGPAGDSGLTGRKIIVDTYGGMVPHGGGAFSGKDPTKVDRSASYAARWVAKNVVAAGLAERCQLQLAYTIGVAKPVSLNVETFGTGVIADARIEELIEQTFNLTPGAILRDLQLRRPIYHPTTAYGHFGRTDIDAPWERTDRVDQLRAAAGI
ncbi:MAG: methionine adenosyltransferase [Chloroflexi bacterium]|nr:methionine adenosyltransferase [Chloroflexota bacterium]